MGEAGRARLEMELGQHYAAQRKAVGVGAIDAIASAMVAEDARMRRTQPCHMGAAEFVASQVRYIPAWTWAAQAALVVFMCVVAYGAGDAGSTKVSVGILSAMCVLVGVPTVHASKLHRVAELEYACLHNTASVFAARLIVLGCSSALAVALMVGVVASSLEVNAFTVALWACPPFFGSCATALSALRKASPDNAVPLTVSWVMGCCAALLAFAIVFPEMYGNASLAVWAVAAALALAWLVREATVTMRTAAAGLDAFSPHVAKTYH